MKDPYKQTFPTPQAAREAANELNRFQPDVGLVIIALLDGPGLRTVEIRPEYDSLMARAKLASLHAALA